MKTTLTLIAVSLLSVASIFGQEIRPYSEYQKTHQNTIIFSNQAIPFMKEIPSQLVTEWDMNSIIFYREYFEKTIEYQAKEYNKLLDKKESEIAFVSVVTKITINNKHVSYYILSSKEKDYIETWTAASGKFDVDDPSGENNQGFLANALRNAFVNMGSKFVSGEYNIKIERFITTKESLGIRYDYDWSEHLVSPHSSGNLKIKISEKAYQNYLKNLCFVSTRVKGALEDKTLESKTMDLFESRTNIKPAYVRILSAEWNIKRNAYGVILYRYILTEVTYPAEGHYVRCKYFVQQNYDGSKYQSSVKENYGRHEYKRVCDVCIEWRKKNVD